MELYQQDKCTVLGEKPVPVPLCPPQIPNGLAWNSQDASKVTSHRLTAQENDMMNQFQFVCPLKCYKKLTNINGQTHIHS
jgi:hypothetical protein